jgi:hypothetical protein
MNHMIPNASSVTARCKRFTAFQASRLRAAASTVRINKCHNVHSAIQKLYQTLLGSMKRLGLSIIASLVSTSSKAISYTQPVDNCGQKFTLRSGHAQVIHMLDSLGTLLARALRGSGRALKRIARPVAIVIGISLCLPMSHASSGSIEAISPKDYVRFTLDKREAKCLSRLIGKESAWNHKAVGNLDSPTKSYVYGLLQLKNPIVKDKSPIEQIHYGLKYIDHRYQGDTCKAWKHWKDKGWH